MTSPRGWRPSSDGSTGSGGYPGTGLAALSRPAAEVPRCRKSKVHHWWPRRAGPSVPAQSSGTCTFRELRLSTTLRHRCQRPRRLVWGRPAPLLTRVPTMGRSGALRQRCGSDSGPSRRTQPAPLGRPDPWRGNGINVRFIRESGHPAPISARKRAPGEVTLQTMLCAYA